MKKKTNQNKTKKNPSVVPYLEENYSLRVVLCTEPLDKIVRIDFQQFYEMTSAVLSGGGGGHVFLFYFYFFRIHCIIHMFNILIVPQFQPNKTPESVESHQF